MYMGTYIYIYGLQVCIGTPIWFTGVYGNAYIYGLQVCMGTPNGLQVCMGTPIYMVYRCVWGHLYIWFTGVYGDA